MVKILPMKILSHIQEGSKDNKLSMGLFKPFGLKSPPGSFVKAHLTSSCCSPCTDKTYALELIRSASASRLCPVLFHNRSRKQNHCLTMPFTDDNVYTVKQKPCITLINVKALQNAAKCFLHTSSSCSYSLIVRVRQKQRGQIIIMHRDDHIQTKDYSSLHGSRDSSSKT